MVDIPVRIGNCSCVIIYKYFELNLAWFCFKDNAIYLGKHIESRGSEAILNHEYLHVVIYELEGRKATEEFDVLFDENDVIIGENGLPEKNFGVKNCEIPIRVGKEGSKEGNRKLY